MKKITIIILLSAIIVSIFSCNGDPVIPKPRGYFRIDLPEKTYKTYDDDCPFVFELPEYAFIIKEQEDYCWMNLYFPINQATVYLTYKPINNDLTAHLEDAHEFAYKHTVKADAIEETLFVNDSLHVYGMLYNLKGNTASQVQFYLTDSTTHFLRGSLYFNVAPNKDSLAPVVEFIKQDIVHLMESLQWKY
jgi:gliding motility-associated lipoprotein GldD